MLTIHDIHKLEVAKFMHRVSNQCETTNPSSFTPLNQCWKKRTFFYPTHIGFIFIFWGGGVYWVF